PRVGDLENPPPPIKIVDRNPPKAGGLPFVPPPKVDLPPLQLPVVEASDGPNVLFKNMMIGSLRFVPGSDRLIAFTTANPFTITVWDIDANKQVQRIGLVEDPRSMSISPDGGLAIIGGNKIATIYSLANGEAVRSYKVPHVADGGVISADR